ncbi:penicillin-binding protein 1A [Ferrimonas lipolytica]|uniref:Penicillin-binding protein 1A n=1 Tax=Ferrimonas lipolytica TaxID=2724191 RepID=A0A6H1UJL4_9GAMM|nr:PBP1A family penicillin-binding protein [Ferrimonas lipolytica]QIZ78503.1 PBP1A family penicillin-binding protein [Ferrimonas lipolytica]
MKWFKRFLALCCLLAIVGALGLVGLYYKIAPELPDVDSLKTVQLQTPMRVFSADGKLISQFGEKRRIPVRYDEVPQTLIDAILATEDARFFEHKGIDPIGIVRAAFVLVTTGRKAQGASTITMQVARNFFLTREKTYIRKVKEIFIALEIERLLDKEEILELYLNRSFLGNRSYGVGAAAQVYYGKDINQLTLAQMAMIAGLPQAPSAANPIRNPERAKNRRNVVLGRMMAVGAISQDEFNSASAAAITAKYHGAEIELYAPHLAEMARDQLVAQYGEEAAYTQGFNVYLTVDSTTQIQAEKAVLDNLFAYDMRHGYRGPEALLWQPASADTDATVVAADNDPWPEQQIVAHLKTVNTHRELLAAVITQVDEKTAIAMVADGSSIELSWDGIKWARAFISDTRQGRAPKVAADVLATGMQVWLRQQDDQWMLAQIPQASNAFVAIDPFDGAIQALIGGYDFGQSQYNRITQAKRQLGSNIKPFLYSAALNNGFTLASLVNNAPITKWDRSQGTAWRPRNSPDVYTGPTRVRQGLAQSINVMAVRTIRQIGIDTFIDHLAKFGFERNELPRNESLSLGSASATPLENVRGFATFKNGGFLIEPYFIERIEGRNEIILEMAQPQIACRECEQALANQSQQTDNAAAPLLQQCLWPQELLAPRVISEQNAFLIRQTMQSVIWGGGDWAKGTGWNGTAWRAARLLQRRDIGGKTGTTNDAGDTWFSGYAPGIVATSWMGFDNHGRKLGRTSWNANAPQNQITNAESGAKSAGPAWNHFMASYLVDIPKEHSEIPQGIVTARIDMATGKLSNRNDDSSMFEYFMEGTAPTELIETVQPEDPVFEQEQELF